MCFTKHTTWEDSSLIRPADFPGGSTVLNRGEFIGRSGKFEGGERRSEHWVEKREIENNRFLYAALDV
jgi:hypothetical protein